MVEIFKDILNYENHYQVSNLGNIKSVKFGKEIILKTSISNNGYLRVNLSKDNIIKRIPIHQLVAITFLNHKPNGNKDVVNHKNFIKTDNRLANLEIVTNRENSNLKHFKSSSEYIGVSWNKKNKKWVSNININNKQKYLGLFTNEYDAHLAYQSELSKII